MLYFNQQFTLWPNSSHFNNNCSEISEHCISKLEYHPNSSVVNLLAVLKTYNCSSTIQPLLFISDHIFLPLFVCSGYSTVLCLIFPNRDSFFRPVLLLPSILSSIIDCNRLYSLLRTAFT